jgi:8-oxo-dGTP diphosphatase
MRHLVEPTVSSPALPSANELKEGTVKWFNSLCAHGDLPAVRTGRGVVARAKGEVCTTSPRQGTSRIFYLTGLTVWKIVGGAKRSLFSLVHYILMAKDSKKDEVHFEGQIAQKALIEKDGKVLLVLYPAGDLAAGTWDLPGGRLNMGETAIEGLQREVKEEIGADVEVHGVLGTGINIVSDTFRLYVVVYSCTLIDPMAKLTPEAGEIEKIEWRDIKDILTLPMINQVYREVLKEKLV